MGKRMLEDCLKRTSRDYPAGYGFTINYLSDAGDTAKVEGMGHCAWYVLQAQAELGNPDASRFVAAVTEAVTLKQGWRGWMVEACQLVHAAALSGNHLAALTLKAWDHPGYAA